jgi:hypothetical protein
MKLPLYAAGDFDRRLLKFQMHGCKARVKVPKPGGEVHRQGARGQRRVVAAHGQSQAARELIEGAVIDVRHGIAPGADHQADAKQDHDDVVRTRRTARCGFRQPEDGLQPPLPKRAD